MRNLVKVQKLATQLILMASITATVAAKDSVDELRLESLRSTEFVSFSAAFKDQDLIMLFQPECAVCKSQIPELLCLKSVKLLGTNGTTDQLKHELARFKTRWPAFAISQKELKSLSPKLQVVTPMFFKVTLDENQNIRLANLGHGFRKCLTLQKLLTK